MHSYTVQLQSVLYHNEKYSLLRSLDSIANAVRVAGEARVHRVRVVWGDASREPLFEGAEIDAINEQYSGFLTLSYLYFNENTGTSRGHNRMAEGADTEYLVLMNPDVVVCPRFFQKMIRPFEDPAANAGATEAKQSPIEHPKDYNKTTFETDWASGACTMLPTALFRAIGGYDAESFFLYCDDVDMSWRIRLTGKKIYFRPDCPVYHAKSLSTEGAWQPTAAERYYSAQAALLMAYKWSAHDKFKELYAVFSTSREKELREAALHFDTLKREGRLPKQPDPEHKVARFHGNNYAKHRFIL